MRPTFRFFILSLSIFISTSKMNAAVKGYFFLVVDKEYELGEDYITDHISFHLFFNEALETDVLFQPHQYDGNYILKRSFVQIMDDTLNPPTGKRYWSLKSANPLINSLENNDLDIILPNAKPQFSVVIFETEIEIENIYSRGNIFQQRKLDLLSATVKKLISFKRISIVFPHQYWNTYIE